MSDDIGEKLLKEVQDLFNKKVDSNQRIQSLYKKMKNETASYADALDFATEVGETLARCFNQTISSEVLPNGRMYYNIAKKVLDPTYNKNFDMAAEYAQAVQAGINKKAGIGLKAVKPELNQDKIDGIIDIVSGKENYDDIAYMLDEPTVNFTQTVVDATVRANASFQYKAGLSPKIVRTAERRCCKWCRAVAGTYDYEKVKDAGNDVFRRHKNCKCVVEFVPYKGSRNRQNVHDKQWREDPEILEKRKAIKGIDTDGYVRKVKDFQDESSIIKKEKEYLQEQLQYLYKGENNFIPRGTEFETTKVIAGFGSDKKLRVASYFEKRYKIEAQKWSKIVGKIESDRAVFDVHWYENTETTLQYEVKLKIRRDKS